MRKYISILRGINVGGNRKILMADLKALYKKLGFSEIVSYIQSGNVKFETNKKSSQKELGEQIKTAIHQQYGFDVPVLVRTKEELENTIANNPFHEEPDLDTAKLYVSFLADTPTAENLEKLNQLDFSQINLL